MRIKLFFLLTISFYTTICKAQSYCDCDSIKRNKNFNGYCNEYLSEKLKTVKKEKASFKMFIYYEKGAPLVIYPLYYDSRDCKYNIYNRKTIIKTDSIILLNGLLESYSNIDRKACAMLFKDGKLIKQVNSNWGIFRPKKSIGIKIHEIAEYYYTSDKIESYLLTRKYNGKIKFHLHAYKDNKNEWCYDEIKILLNEDPLRLSK